MASPFRLFRKHQKVFIAIAAVVAMFVFVLADPLVSWLQQRSGGQRSPSATVVSWDGGSLNGRELEMLSQRRYFISNFLENLQMFGARRILDEGGTPLQPNVPIFVLRPEESQPRSVMIGVVNTRILSQLATDAGMTVSDEMINHYLREFGLRRVTDNEIADILQRSGRGDLRSSEELLFSGLRELLLANYYMRSYDSDTQNVLPEQRWQDWKKINHRIAVEAAILPADQWISKTPEPTDADLQQFYDLYKNNIADIPQIVLGVQLPSPNPGFREPRRVKLQYLLGDVNAWTDQLLDSVTEEEITDYYERNKRTQFAMPEGTTTGTTTEADTSPESDADEEGEEKSDEENPAQDEENEAGEQKLFNAEQENVDKQSTQEPAAEQATESAEESTSEEPTSEGPASDESGSLKPASRFRLVALQPEGEEKASASDENGEQDTSTEEPAAEAESEEHPQSDEQSEEKPVAYEPLENVRDLIRRQLANDKAVVKLKRAMERAYADLQTEYNRYGGEVIIAESEHREPPALPAKLANLGVIAKELGLVHEETTLLSQMELADTFVGKAVDAQGGRQPVLRAAFAEMQPHEPYLAQDLDGHWYLVLKIEDIPSRVPPFEEIRDRVLAAWKQNEAAKLALETAEELAEEAEKTGETLAGFFADKGYEVVTTDLFSWLSFGTTPMEMQRGPRLGEAPPLTAVGPEFMAKAFALEPGQVTALLNHDQSSAYVIRLDRREKTEEELRRLFLLEANDWFGGRVMAAYRGQTAQHLLIGQLTKRVNLDASKLEEYLQPDEQR